MVYKKMKCITVRYFVFHIFYIFDIHCAIENYVISVFTIKINRLRFQEF